MIGCGCGGGECRLAAGDERHGTPSGYAYWRCRCEICRQWRSEYRHTEDREVSRRYYESNRAKEAARHARYHRENADKVRARTAAYRRTPEGTAANRAMCAKYRARKKALDCGCASTSALRVVWALDCGLCAYCGVPAAEIDHVVPLASGGWHCVRNLRAACRRCNNSKRAQPLGTFLARLAASGVEVRPGATNSGLPCPAAAARMAARMLPAPPRSVTAA